MIKKKSLSLFIICLFMLSVFNSPIGEPQPKPPESGEGSQTSIPNTQPEILADPFPSSPTQTTSSINYDSWYLGESVNVTYQYPKSFSSNVTDWTITDTTIDFFDPYTNMWVDDDDWYRAYIYDVGTPTEELLVPPGYTKISEMVLYFEFSARTLGSLHFELNCYGVWNGGPSTITPPPGHNTAEVGLEYVDIYNEKIDIKIVAQTSATMGYIDNAYAVFIRNQENSTYVKLHEYDYVRIYGTIDPNTFWHLRITSDFLWYEPQPITSSVRPDYQYISPTQRIHILDISIYEYKTNMTIFLDESDEIEVTPDVYDLEYIYERWTFETIIPSDYQIKWFRNCSNLLTIEDVSTDYFDSVGFEGGTYLNDLSEQSGYDWDTMSVATDIVFEGYYSVELENTVASRSIISIDALEGRVLNFYFQISVYYETVTSGSLYIYYRDVSGVWTTVAIDNTILNRWQTIQIFVADADYYGVKGYFRIDTCAGTNFQGKVYIDNIGIFETSTEIKTLGYSEYQIDFDAVVADGYKFAQDSFREYQVEIWDRTAQTLEYSYSTITDSLGHGTVIHYGGLEQKEYEIRTVSYDSWWIDSEPNRPEYETDSTTHWGVGSGTGIITMDGDAVKIQVSDADATNWIKWQNGEITDISAFDYLVFEAKDNTTIDIDKTYIGQDGTNYYYKEPLDIDFTSSFVQYVYTYDWLTTGTELNPDITIYDFFQLRVMTDYYTVWLRDLHWVSSQKLYFTPALASETDYAETELLDAWDFTEGDKDGWLSYDCISDTIENGYFERISNTPYSKYYIENIEDFDETYYTIIIFKIWSNISQTISIRQTTGGLWGTNRGETFYALVSNTWRIIELAVVSAYDIDCIRISADVNPTWKLMRLDHFLIVHRDSRLPDTNDYATDELHDAWDFEEYDTGTVLDGWQENVGAQTIELEDGCFKVDITGSDAYVRNVATGLSISASTYTQIVITIKTNEDDLQILFADAGNNIITAKTKIGVADVWHTLIFDIDSGYWAGVEANFYYWLYDSSGNFEGDEFFWIEEIRLLHLEELSYQTLQNSVLLESESNDLQYTLWIDHHLIGTFYDLSLIPFNASAGTHYLQVQPFKTDDVYCTQNIYSWYYTVDPSAFSVSVESFYLSDLYVNTYVTSNYDAFYIVYEDGGSIDSGTLHKEGTTIITNRDVTVGASINYTIAFTYNTEMIPFKAYYNNPSSDFFVTDYRINTTAPDIVITWDTSKNTIDSLTAIENGVEKATDDPTSTTSWTKSTSIGVYYVILIFSATDYNDIIFSFTYTVSAIEEFKVNVQNVIPSDDYMNIYCTSNYDYSYTAWTNGSESGSGNGLSVGTFIIIPKTKEAGLFNLTLAFVNGSETVLFMAWYSNLIPPPDPSNDLYRTESQGFYNISLYTNLDFYWIDIYHDSDLIVDDSTATLFSIPKALLVGWHNITFVYLYNCSTDADGYPIAEYNETISYEFWYETKLFFDVRLRYVPIDLGLAIGDFHVSWVRTYFDGELVQDGSIIDIPEYSNYTFISNYDIRIKNNMPTHNLVVTDLFDRLIINTTIDISTFTSAVLELPIYRLGVINLDDESHKLAIRPYLTTEPWQFTPVIPPNYFIEFWVCNRTYDFRIYSIGTTYTEDGVLITIWDDFVDLLPQQVPCTITMPLTLAEEEEVAIEKDKQLRNIGLGVGISTLAILTIMFIYLVRFKRKIKGRVD